MSTAGTLTRPSWVVKELLTSGHKQPPALCYNFPAGRRFPTLNQLRIDRLLSAVSAGLDDGSRALLETLTCKANEQSLPLYLVGGPVRDAALGLPVKDLDLAFEGDAIALARTLGKELGWQVVVHTRFGTAALIHRGSRVDLVTARREVYDSPGALPRVIPGSIRQDLARRDFSINALALPLGESEPRILDFHRGLDDLRRGIVRILHPGSFVDDPTRILRAVRYEQRLGFRLEPDTENRLRRALAGGAVDTVSGDRLRHELERILAEDQPAPALRRALDMGVLSALHPAWGDDAASSRLADALYHLEAAANPLPPLAWLAALVYPLPAPAVPDIARRLNLTGRQRAVVLDTVALRQLETTLSQPPISRSEVCRQLQGLDEAAVTAAIALSGNGLARQRLGKYLREWRFVRPALDGAAVMAMGVEPGPAVGQLIKKLHNARLDCRVRSEEEERQLVRRVLAKSGGR